MIRHQKRAKYCIKLQNNFIVCDKEKLQCNTELSDQKTLHDKEKRQYEIRLSDQKAAYDKEKLRYETRLMDQKVLYERGEVLHEIKLSEQKSIYETKLSEQKSIYETKLSEQKSLYETKLSEFKCFYEKEIKEYKSYVSELCLNQKPKIVNTTYQNNVVNNIISGLEVMVPSKIEDSCEYLTVDHLIRGAKGIAKFAMDHPFKNRIYCSDTSRRTIKYKNENGDVITDPGAKKVTDYLIEGIRDRVHMISADKKYDLEDETIRKIFQNGADLYNSDSKTLSMLSKELCLLSVQAKN